MQNHLPFAVSKNKLSCISININPYPTRLYQVSFSIQYLLCSRILHLNSYFLGNQYIQSLCASNINIEIGWIILQFEMWREGEDGIDQPYSNKTPLRWRHFDHSFAAGILLRTSTHITMHVCTVEEGNVRVVGVTWPFNEHISIPASDKHLIIFFHCQYGWILKINDITVKPVQEDQWRDHVKVVSLGRWSD